MAHQLHYASVAKGASGRSGFQFTARSHGASPEVERVVERFMTYRPPSEASGVEQCPVSLAYEPSAYGAILVCCRYLGADYTGRPGNFLGHAVLADPEELDGLRPIELWRAPFWAARPADTLQPLPLTAGEAVDPERVAALLAAAGDTGYALLAALVDATRDALAGHAGAVTLVSDDVDTTALWIAAVSYSLPIGIARGLSFVTYTADPMAARQHLIGTTPAAWAASRSDGVGFHLTPVRPPEPTSPNTPYAAAVVAAWRTGDLAQIDTLCAVAANGVRTQAGSAARGGGLDAAAALLSLCRGEPVEPRYQGPALRLLEALPEHDRARLLDRTAASLAGADRSTVDALLGGDAGDQLADLLVDRDWSTAPQVGRLVYARHGQRHSERRTEMASRLADLGTEDVAETIAQLWHDHEPSVAECGALLERLDRHTADDPAVRDVIARALSGADPSDEAARHLARTVASRYPAGDPLPGHWPYDSPFDVPDESGSATADAADPSDSAPTAPPVATDVACLAASARAFLAAAALADGCGRETAPERLAEYADLLAWWHPYADSALAGRMLRHGARALCDTPVWCRVEVLRIAAAPTAQLVVTDWLAHTPDDPDTRADLAELAVRLRGHDVTVPALTEYLVALARRPLAFRRAYRTLQGRGGDLAEGLRSLVFDAGGGWRAVFRRPAGS